MYFLADLYDCLIFCYLLLLVTADFQLRAKFLVYTVMGNLCHYCVISQIICRQYRHERDSDLFDDDHSSWL